MTFPMMSTPTLYGKIKPCSSHHQPVGDSRPFSTGAGFRWPITLPGVGEALLQIAVEIETLAPNMESPTIHKTTIFIGKIWENMGK